jgi:hypothetical protein
VSLSLCLRWLEKVPWLVALVVDNVINLCFWWLENVCLFMALLALVVCDVIILFFIVEQSIEFLYAPFYFILFYFILFVF